MISDPSALIAGFAIIFVSIIGGFIVSAIPDPVGVVAETPLLKDNPDAQKVYETYEKANRIYTAGEKSFMTMKLIGQFALFLGFPFATVYGLAKAE